MSSDKPRVIFSEQWTLKVAKELGLRTDRLHTLTIVSVPRQPIKVIVEYWGDERLLSVDAPPVPEITINASTVIPPSGPNEPIE